MGMFSWIYSDTGKQMLDGVYKKSYLLVPPPYQKKYGKYIEEECYDGYGIMGGFDVYNLVAEWNFPVVQKSSFRNCTDDFVDKLFELREKNASDEEYEKLYNTLEWKRIMGIDIACYDEQNASLPYPIKIVENKDLDYEKVKHSISDPNQGWF